MFELQKSLLEQREFDINKGRDKELGKIVKMREKQVLRITEEANTQTRDVRDRCELRRIEARGEYARNVASDLMSQLEQDYKEIQRRSDLFTLPNEAIEEARKIHSVLENVELSKAKQIFEAFNPSSVTREAYKFIESGIETSQISVHSYIASDGDTNMVLLLTPVDGEQNKHLAKSLEEKIDLVLDSGEVMMASSVVENQGQVLRSELGNLRFGSEMGEDKGFLLYTITPFEEGTSELLASGLTKKLAELQPQGFGEAKIRHDIVPVEFEAFRYFREKTKDELHGSANELEKLAVRTDYATIDEVAHALGLKTRGIAIMAGKGIIEINEEGRISTASLLEYASKKKGAVSRRVAGKEKRTRISYALLDSTVEELRAEAQKRLDTIREEISPKDIAYVLGMGCVASATSLINRKKWTPVREDRRRKYYSKAQLQEQVNTCTPTPERGWMYKK